ncbi:transaldolase [Mucilaginibacter jinjuensis]|uniref:Transaldolase n=1 Tax=Mucilaginibacter jinjuensis TaxID=1176721 RepID=A0ABY7TFC8_9SPHI|nr:transaldolase [Mucilaginibacter jinjuensis]WCT14799.1 transaldolase [Mucilaginibacter jinjuensis]
MKNPLAQIPDFGQSIWLDYIRRSFISSGELKKLIDEDDLRGVTSNPAIFEEAIAHSDDYNDTINELAKTDLSTEEIFLKLAVEDVQNAADLFKGVYEKTDALDGYVSLEVSPGLAKDTEGSIAEARSSWKTLDRKNVMIKIPGTEEGIPAIKELISEGININVTLLFGLERYRAVAEAYVEGLEARLAKGESIEHVASVASFFLSRIDTMLDPQLEEIIKTDSNRATPAKQLLGKVAIASARVAYHIYKEVFKSERFKALEAKGAKPQRLLWASTSVKNKAYDPLMYLEALIGPETVDTVPKDTLALYRENGHPADRLEQELEEAQYQLYQLEDVVGIKLLDVTKKLEEEGIEKFIKPFGSLMDVLAKKRQEAAV